MRRCYQNWLLAIREKLNFAPRVQHAGGAPVVCLQETLQFADHIHNALAFKSTCALHLPLAAPLARHAELPIDRNPCAATGFAFPV